MPMNTETVLEVAEEYSLNMLMSWNHRFVRGAVDWCVQNWQALLALLVDLASLFLVCSAASFLIRKAILWIGKRHQSVAEEMTKISRPIVWLVFWFGLSNCAEYVPFPTGMHNALNKFFYVCFILVFLSIFQHTLLAVSAMLIEHFKRRDPKKFGMNKLLLDLSLSIIRLLAWSYVVIFILQEVFHFKVTHLIASAGIAGLAIAFAAKDTISNIFGAFSILGCKMFHMGDWIKTGDTEGVVEQIGFRSVRIRAFNNGRLIDIPNNIIANSKVENFNRHLFWREYFCFGLTYQTTPEQLALAKKILYEIAKDMSHALVHDRPPQFDFMLFDSSSLNLDGYLWFKPMGLYDMRHMRSHFNEEVLKRFNAAGISMAYPTTTVIMEGGQPCAVPK